MKIYFMMTLVIISLTSCAKNAFARDGQSLKPTSLTDQLIGALIGGVISSSVISVVVGVLFNRKTTTIQEGIRNQFQILRSRRVWKEQSVSELLGPVSMLLDRTEIAFKRWSANALSLEAEIIAKSNQKIHEILLEKGHLIPPELLSDASKLIEHYDI